MRIAATGHEVNIQASHKEVTKLQKACESIVNPQTPKAKKFGIAVIGAFLKMCAKAKAEGHAGNEACKKG